jgi:uncharacterized repeat protein (TIGR01451 family)
MAPGLSQILIYEASTNSFTTDDILEQIATDKLAHQISASWTYPIDSVSDQIFLQMQAQGQTFFNASGDSGAYPPGEVPTPADDTNITVVGGTTLYTTGPGGPWQSETVWSWFTQGTGTDAGSGGISTNYAIPPWQMGISMTSNMGSTTFRNLPDVALTADNIFIVADNGTQEPVGGTSAATPLWAAFMALVNEQSFISGKPPLGFLNPLVYGIGKGPLYGSTFHDITTGNNTNLVSTNLFYAVPGYDLCTGWGTPTGSNLINALAPPLLTPVLTIETNFISGGNGTGIIVSDECSSLTVVLTNQGRAAATTVLGLLSSLTPGVIVAQGTSHFPNIPPNGAAANPSAFIVSTEPEFVCGTPVNLMLVVKCDQAIETNLIQLPSGTVGLPVSFANPTPYNIPATSPLGVYSPVVVSGLGSVSSLTVSLYATTVYDYAFGIELISPGGATVTLLSEDYGGLGQNFGAGCVLGSETTFDDAAGTSIINGTPPYIGSYSPQEPLSTFNLLNGTNLNGVWMLHVFNAFELAQDIAALQCWSLNITPNVCANGGGQCPGADLSLTMSANPPSVVVGSNLIYNLTVSNAGPSAASDIVISQTLPAGVVFQSISNYQAGVTQIASNLDLTLTNLPVYGTATVSVITVPYSSGLITSVATVGSPQPDPNPNNNSASATALVTMPLADLAVTMTAYPGFVLEGAPLTYTISVTNNGPSTAQQVALINSLPPEVNFISATTTQGTIGPGAATVQIGTLAPGAHAVVTVVVSPSMTGSLTASTLATLSPLETNPDAINASASVTVTVGPSADLAVSAVSIPATVLSGSNFACVATVVNNGPSAATGVVFSQTIPSGAAFVSSSRAGAIVTNGVIVWTVGSLPVGVGGVITNVLKAPKLLPGVQSNLLSSSLSAFGQPGNAVTNNSIFTLHTLVEPPTVTIVPAGSSLVLPANGNGSVNPQETVELQFFLQNIGTVGASDLVATLQASGGVTSPSGPQNYGALAPGGAAVGRLFSFTANSTNGGTVVATLQLQDGAANLGSVTFPFVMPLVATFWNTNEIAIPNSSYILESGPANPYPSTILVSNVTGTISEVGVTISNMAHTYPNDVGMMLIGPSGEASTLMMSAAAGSAMFGVTFTLDPTASAPLPASGDILPGAYLPEEYQPVFLFTNAPVTAAAANLAVFDGLAPNGTWSLYVYDGVNGDDGYIANGWSLTITTSTPISPVSDLVAGIVALTNQVTTGNQVTFVLSVTNNSATSAVTAYLTNVLSSGLTFASSSYASGDYVQNGQTTVYTLGSLAPGAGLTITNVVTASAAGPQTNTIYAGSALPPGNGGNNVASAVINDILPYAHLGAFISVAANPVVVNNNLIYTLIVTNYGPSNAVGVVGNFSLGGLNLVSEPSNATSNNNIVTVTFGTVDAGYIASVAITTAPPAVLTLTNVWSVSANNFDPNPAYHTVSNIVTVIYPVPLITNGAATLPQNLANPNGTVNSGEPVTVGLTLINIGSGPTSNLVATLQAGGGIVPGALSQQTYGVIQPNGGSATANFSFTVTNVSGAATATLRLTQGTNVLGTVSFVFPLPVTTNYFSSSAITIPEIGRGNPYPSQILVSGLTGYVVGNVTATLHGFAHSYPHDVSVLLASPAGQELLLMSHVGGPYSVSNLTLTFDGSATQALSEAQLVSGTNLPSVVSAFTAFPGVPAPSTETNLAFFDGTDPNGYWSLYVYDDTEGNDGVISGGWSLGLTAVATVNPAARLEAGMVHAPDPVYVGNYLNYQIAITNLGPGNASNVILVDALPASLAFSSAAVSQGTVSNSGNTVTCNIGTMIPGAIVTAGIRVVAAGMGLVANTASVTTSSTDLYLADSTVSNTGIVAGPVISFLTAADTAAGLQLSLRGQPDQSYGVEVSTNLSTWTLVSSNTADSSGTFIYTDPQTNAPERFYRVLQLAQ